MKAQCVMRSLNPHALCGSDGGNMIAIEDVRDPDGRWYRIEYRCKPDGSAASAWLLHNPWGANNESYARSHLRDDGFICVASNSSSDNSPHDLKFVVERARFWCTGYSFMREHGYRATCDTLPEWRG